MKIQDSGINENKIGVKLMKEAATESELNSIYLTHLLHDVDHSLVLTFIVVRIISVYRLHTTVKTSPFLFGHHSQRGMTGASHAHHWNSRQED